MLCRHWLLLLFFSLGGVNVVAAQQDETPLEVSPCLLESDPGAYHHKLVRVRSGMNFGFENFTLSGKGCGKTVEFSNVWLEFGGDIGAQTIYCCGDHSRTPQTEIKIDGYVIPLEKNQELSEFLRLLNAAREKAPNGGPCYDCYYYRVTASLVGRFFAGGWPNEKQSTPLPKAGYGHLGCCSLLVIERVSDVSAERTEIPDNARFRCKKHSWKWTPSEGSDREERIASVENGAESWRTKDWERVGVEAIRQLAEKWQIKVPTTQPRIYLDVSGKVERAEGTWTSGDWLSTFTIEMRKLEELAPEIKGPAKDTWILHKLTGETCVATN